MRQSLIVSYAFIAFIAADRNSNFCDRIRFAARSISFERAEYNLASFGSGAGSE